MDLIFDSRAMNYVQVRPTLGCNKVTVAINDPWTRGGASIELDPDQVDEMIAQLQAAKKGEA